MPTFFGFFGFFHQNGVIGKVNQCYLLLRLKDKWDGSRPNKMTLRFARITRTVKPRKTHKRVGRKADFLWRENHQDGGSGHNGMQLEVKRLVKFVVPAVRFHCLVYRANFLAIFCMGCRAIIRSLSIVWCWLFRCRPWNMFPANCTPHASFPKEEKRILILSQPEDDSATIKNVSNYIKYSSTNTCCGTTRASCSSFRKIASPIMGFCRHFPLNILA